ncbi:MAG: stage II sporulation protein M [Myxococcaceae bacterium]|nr:stage II sporulation protein M [Myxococcaceae bacterium]
MEIAHFVDQRRPRWVALELLLQKAETQGLTVLALEEARELSRLYRSASSDLLQVRARGGAAEVSEYLNDLVGRAYALTYPGQRLRPRAILAFVTRGFPALMRKEMRAYAASVLITFGGFAFGWIGMEMDPEAAPYLMPSQHQELDPVKRAADEAKKDSASTQEQAAFASFLYTHNIQVAFLAFALGITAGIGTAIMLFGNGLLLGSLAWAYASKGLTGWFWAWILPHGIPELSAICIAGAAGFVIARGLAAPKGLSRRQALRKEGITAVKLLLGTLALFVLAGLIEGTVSQIHPPRLSVAFKITFALVVGTGVYLYLLSGYAQRGEAQRA